MKELEFDLKIVDRTERKREQRKPERKKAESIGELDEFLRKFR